MRLHLLQNEAPRSNRVRPDGWGPRRVTNKAKYCSRLSTCLIQNKLRYTTKLYLHYIWWIDNIQMFIRDVNTLRRRVNSNAWWKAVVMMLTGVVRDSRLPHCSSVRFLGESLTGMSLLFVPRHNGSPNKSRICSRLHTLSWHTILKWFVLQVAGFKDC